MDLLRRLATTSSLLLSFSALAAGLDRDGLVSEAPATPDTGVVRISGGGGGEVATTASGTVNASVMWAPIEHLAGDVSGYLQSDSRFGPSARLRYQLLNQASHGLDLALGLRFKFIGFTLDPNYGGGPSELEFLVAAGRKFGPVDVVLNAVTGTELGGAPGKDSELKAYVGYNLMDTLRLGVDSRVQAEWVGPGGIKTPDFTNDVALVAGPTVSWLVTPKVQFQALAGALKGRGNPVGVGGLGLLAIDL
ncbi:MAG TPA: hypothetical protein VND93_28505 [Myxococcales bacterium]|nr:hypothetical protein [Myxococcales bacterium]